MHVLNVFAPRCQFIYDPVILIRFKSRKDRVAEKGVYCLDTKTSQSKSKCRQRMKFFVWKNCKIL